jgi:hypothetical protein
MEKKITILAIILLIAAGFVGCKQSSSNQSEGIITVDVTKTSYPKKELILQDYMDVEYVVLETNDDFLNQGFVQDIGKEIIIVRNRTDDGNIFVYDRNGKALRTINRKGGGGEEYTNLYSVTLDEDNEEMFVNDIYSKKIIVYDLFGKFKRSFKHKEDTEAKSMFYTEIFNYDNNNLICYDSYNEKIAFLLISKQDGSIAKEITIPFKEKKTARASRRDEASGMTYSVSPGPYRTIIPYNGNWLLAELSSDTIFTLLPDLSLQPFMVRTPSVQSMTPEVFLLLRVFSDRYYFMETIKNEFSFESNDGFPRTFMVYDRQEKAIFNYTVYNGDYSTKKEEYMNARPVSHEIESWQSIEPFRLIEANEKGELKGKLKEVAEKLAEDDNPVIVLLKHKK